MGKYEEALLNYMDSKDFVRTFYGECPNCNLRIWSIGEEYDLEKGHIKAHFVCNCGKKFKKVVFSKKNKYKYRYPQGLVEYLDSTTKDSVKVIKTAHNYYTVSPDKIEKFEKV